MIICPKCMRSQFVQPSGSTHYVCTNDPMLSMEETGCGSQFTCIKDDYIRFPHNVIFVDRGKQEFYRKQYLQVTPSSLILNE